MEMARWNAVLLGQLTVMSSLVLLPLVGSIVEKKYTRADFPPPPHFVFGSATSAYQVEGATLEDGRTPSIWDTFVHAHSDFYGGATGDVACDQYHKYKEDVHYMVDTSLEAYRFSISWSRLIPDGRGPVNPKGLEYYNNLIDELIMHGVQPHVTMYHMDTPQALEDEYGGWLSRRMVRDFTAYADVCFREFGDRVRHWTTINEANAFALGGYDEALIPPGRCSLPYGLACTEGNSSTEPYIAAHNMLLAHSSVVKLYKRKYKVSQHGFVGLNIYAPWFLPYTKAAEDVVAAQRSIEFYIGWFLHPLVFGDYPDMMKKNAKNRIPALTPDDSELVKGSFDFIGINHYATLYIKDNPTSLKMETRDVSGDMAATIMFEPGDALPDQDNETSGGLYEVLEYLKRVYANPLTYIHENVSLFALILENYENPFAWLHLTGQQTMRNGTLNDTARMEYMHAYIGALLGALRNGANTKGYFMWSFLDGFEVVGGYEKGFGMYFVDLDDKGLRRYPKLSAHWYSNFLLGKSIRLPNEIIEDGQQHFVSPVAKYSG